MTYLSKLLLGIQGIPIALFGSLILYDPSKAGYEDVTPDIAHAVGFTSLSLSMAYIVAMNGSIRTRHWFLLTAIPLRVGAGIVFLGDGNKARGAPMWDLVHAALNLVVVGLERLGM